MFPGFLPSQATEKKSSWQANWYNFIAKSTWEGKKNRSNHTSTAESSPLRHSLVHQNPSNSQEVESHFHMSFSGANVSDEGQGVRATETAKEQELP